MFELCISGDVISTQSLFPPTFTLLPLIFHPVSRALNSILISSLMLDINIPASGASNLCPLSSSFWQTCCFVMMSESYVIYYAAINPQAKVFQSPYLLKGKKATLKGSLLSGYTGASYSLESLRLKNVSDEIG